MQDLISLLLLGKMSVQETSNEIMSHECFYTQREIETLVFSWRDQVQGFYYHLLEGTVLDFMSPSQTAANVLTRSCGHVQAWQTGWDPPPDSLMWLFAG